MNEKAKKLIKHQNDQLYSKLKDTFGLPVFQDNVADDEKPDKLNLFLIVYGDVFATDSKGSLYQEVYVTYLAEGKDGIEEDTIDIITTVTNGKGVLNFVRTEKDQVRKLTTNEFVDRITFNFRRVIKYDG